jgi:hypothetical protein
MCQHILIISAISVFSSNCDNISLSKWYIESGRKCEEAADFYLHIPNTKWPLLACSQDSKLLGPVITNQTLKCWHYILAPRKLNISLLLSYFLPHSNT